MPATRTPVNDRASLTIRQVADYLQVAERTVYKLAWAGELPGFKVGNTWSFKKEDLERWIEARKRRARSSSRR